MNGLKKICHMAFTKLSNMLAETTFKLMSFLPLLKVPPFVINPNHPRNQTL
jgi:hypothetical protein